MSDLNKVEETPEADAEPQSLQENLANPAPAAEAPTQMAAKPAPLSAGEQLLSDVGATLQQQVDALKRGTKPKEVIESMEALLLRCERKTGA